MHGSKTDIPRVMDGKSFVSHSTAWGDMVATIDRWDAGFDGSPFFAALPEGMCPVPHWGYVSKGRVRIRYRDREEVIEAGQAFYLEPGHIPFADEDSELVYFSPADEMAKTEALLKEQKKETETRPQA